jgi:hypothetical protein
MRYCSIKNGEIVLMNRESKAFFNEKKNNRVNNNLITGAVADYRINY